MSQHSMRPIERWFSTWPLRTSVVHLPRKDLGEMLMRFRPLTVLISQRNRGGLGGWPPGLLKPDVVVNVPNGDGAAQAVSLCIKAKMAHGWPLLCVVMGASHAFARIHSAARAEYGSGVYVVVVEGR